MEMKKIVIGLFALTACVAFQSCSSDDEPKVEVDSEVVSACASGELTKCYKLVDREYHGHKNGSAKSAETKGDYIVDPLEYDPSDWTILFMDGKTITPLHWDSSDENYGTISILNEVWYAYRKMANSKVELYVAVPFGFDESNSSFRTLDRTYSVMVMKEDKLRLKYKDEDRDSRIVYDYVKYPISQYELDQCAVFDSKLEAYRYIAETAKDFFGSKLELCKVYPSATGIIDIDDLLERLDKGMY